MSSNVKNLFAKLNWLRSYWAVNFVYSAIFSTIFRNLVIFRMSYLRNQMRFSKTFFTFQFFYEYSFKICFNLSWHKLKVIFSLRTKRLEVVASRKNGRARRRHACLPRARVLSRLSHFQFYCQFYDVIFVSKTVNIKNPKTCDCWEYKVLLSCSLSLSSSG